MAESDVSGAESDGIKGFMGNFASELFGNPINLILLGVCGFLLLKIVKNKRTPPPKPPEPELPSLKKRDFTLEQLREFDGQGPDGRLLMAVNCKVFDVTRGKRFYGPGGPYGVFAGRDASRGLATFSLTEDAIRDEYDDLTDLNTMQMDSIREWEMQFMEKYDLVGRLLRPGEEPTEYTDTEEEHSNVGDSTHDKSKSD